MTPLAIFGALCVVVGMAAGVLIGLWAPPPRRRETLVPEHPVLRRERHERLQGHRSAALWSASAHVGADGQNRRSPGTRPRRGTGSHWVRRGQARERAAAPRTAPPLDPRHLRVVAPPAEPTTFIDAEALGWLEGA